VVSAWIHNASMRLCTLITIPTGAGAGAAAGVAAGAGFGGAAGAAAGLGWGIGVCQPPPTMCLPRTKKKPTPNRPGGCKQMYDECMSWYRGWPPGEKMCKEAYERCKNGEDPNWPYWPGE
jgi:hypothetical protein